MHLFCNLQRRARTHTVLVIGLYELLDNPTTQLIEPPRLNIDESGVKHQKSKSINQINTMYLL
jgi:hypothetical protein